MNRRAFLGAIGVVTATGTPVIATESQAPTHAPSIHGWRLHWSGWREPANQLVRVGFWVAIPPESFTPDNGDMRAICCTTTGEMQRLRETSVVSFARFDSTWPISVLQPDEVFEAAKARALNAVEIWIRKHT